MNLSYTSAQCYQNLIDRAELYFQAKIEDAEENKKPYPAGAAQWIRDLEYTRNLELTESARQPPNTTDELDELLV